MCVYIYIAEICFIYSWDYCVLLKSIFFCLPRVLKVWQIRQGESELKRGLGPLGHWFSHSIYSYFLTLVTHIFYVSSMYSRMLDIHIFHSSSTATLNTRSSLYWKQGFSLSWHSQRSLNKNVKGSARQTLSHRFCMKWTACHFISVTLKLLHYLTVTCNIWLLPFSFETAGILLLD